MRSHTIRSLTRAALALAFVVPCSGCISKNALLFYEGAKLGFTAQFQPNSAQPIEAHLGFKRRVIAIVPPRHVEPGPWSDPEKALNKGEALSLVSTFEVKAHAMSGVEVHNYFASGAAADLMTNPPTRTTTVTKEAVAANGTKTTTTTTTVEPVAGASDATANAGKPAGKPTGKKAEPTSAPVADKAEHVSEVGKRIAALMEKTGVAWPPLLPYSEGPKPADPSPTRIP